MGTGDQAAGQPHTLDAQTCLTQDGDHRDRFCLLETIDHDNENTALGNVFCRQGPLLYSRIWSLLTIMHASICLVLGTWREYLYASGCPCVFL